MTTGKRSVASLAQGAAVVLQYCYFFCFLNIAHFLCPAPVGGISTAPSSSSRLQAARLHTKRHVQWSEASEQFLNTSCLSPKRGPHTWQRKSRSSATGKEPVRPSRQSSTSATRARRAAWRHRMRLLTRSHWTSSVYARRCLPVPNSLPVRPPEAGTGRLRTGPAT